MTEKREPAAAGATFRDDLAALRGRISALAAEVTVVDELTRAVPNITAWAKRFRGRPEEARGALASFDNAEGLRAVRERICRGLEAPLRQ